MNFLSRKTIDHPALFKENYFVLRNSLKLIYGLGLLVILFFNILWTFRNNDLKDFGSFIAAGQAANLGQNPYLVDSPYTFVVTFAPLNLTVPSYNLNPPISVLLFQGLSKFDPLLSYRLWQGFSFLCYALLIFVYWKNDKSSISPLKILWAFCLGGLWHTLELGQIYLPFVLLFGIAFYLLYNKKFEWVAGILLGLCVAIKPNFVLIVIFLLLIKKYRTSFFALCSAATITLIPILVYGIKIYTQWMDAVSKYNGYAIPGNNSFLGLLTRFGLEQLNPILVLIVIPIGLYVVWKNQFSIFKTGMIAVLITLFTSPVAWPGYTTFLIPSLLKTKWNIFTILAALILVIPVFIIYDNYYHSIYHMILLSWLYGWSMIFLFISFLRKKNIHGNINEKTL